MTIFKMHSSVDRHMGYFQYVVIVNSNTKNITFKGLWLPPVTDSLGDVPRSGIAEIGKHTYIQFY